MPVAFLWNDDHDVLIREQRKLGIGWTFIAEQVGVARWTLIDHAKRIDAYNIVPELSELAPEEIKVDRGVQWTEALPPGHPYSWGPICRGMPYPKH